MAWLRVSEGRLQHIRCLWYNLDCMRPGLTLILCGGRLLLLLLRCIATRRLQLADVVAEEVVDGDELVEVAVRVEQELQHHSRP